MANPNPFLNSNDDELYKLPELPQAKAADSSRFEPVSPSEVKAEVAPATRAAPTRADVIRRAMDLDVDPRLALSIWSQESANGRNSRDSSKGAVGGFQVMPDTGRAMIGDKDLRDPWNNLEAGLRYIAYGQKTLNTKDPELLAAGYHAGYDRKSLKNGIIPNVSDGAKNTRDYAREVAARAGGQPAGRLRNFEGDATDGGKFEPVSADEVKAAGLPMPDESPVRNDGVDDQSHYEALSPADIQALGISPPLQTAPQVEAKAPEPSAGDKLAYLGKSLKAGGYDMLGATAKVLDAVNPWTLSESDAAVLFKNDPAKLKEYQDNSTAMVLSRFAHNMTKHAEDSMKEAPAAATAYYKDKVYATTDQSKAAYREPTKVIADTVRSLPTMAALAVTTYFTRGAATQAEKAALAEGMTAAEARAVGVQAGMKAAAKVGAASEGAVGYGQQAEQSWSDASQVSDADMAKSPMYQNYRAHGFTHEAARAKVIADTAEQSGRIAGIVDAAVNHYGGQFLGKILTEGGSLIPRIMKGGATEGITETLQSGGEQYGQNLAEKQNINPNKSLTEGVGESMAQGGIVGFVSGGPTAAIGGKGHDGVTPAAEVPQVAPAPAPAAPAPAPADPPPASTAPGPLSRSVENAADKHAADNGAPRVTATAPDGTAVQGELHNYQETPDGGFTAQVVDDDGQVVTISDKDGVTIAPQEHTAGPLESSVHAADDGSPLTEEAVPAPTPAEEPPAAEFAPEAAATAPEAAAPVPVEPAQDQPAEQQRAPRQPVQADLSGMSADDLRARLKYVASQAKSAGGWNKMLMEERRRVEQEINLRNEQPTLPLEPEKPAATAEEKPNGPADRGEPRAVPGDAAITPRADVPAEPGAGGAAAERTSEARPPALSRELAGAKPRYSYGVKQFDLTFANDIDRAAYIAAQKTPSKRDAEYVKFVADHTGMSEAEVRAHGAKVRDAIKGIAKTAEAGKLDVPAVRGAEQTAAPAQATTPAPAEAVPAARDEHAGKWFGSREKAGAYIAKKAVGETHQVEQTGKVRFEVKPKAVEPVAEQPAPAPAKPTKLDEGRERARKQEEAVRQAAENIAKRKAEKEAAEPAPAQRRGEVGGKLESGETVLTASGRETTPFPKIKLDTDRKAGNTLKAVDQWLMQNALDEARSRGDKFNARQFEASQAKPSQSDKDSAEEYLFGEQPGVVPSILKPLTTSTKPAHVAEVKAEEPAPAAPAKPDPFSGNKLFTSDAVEKARARMRSKLTQFNSGIDPEMMVDGVTLAGAYLESGIRKFADYAKAMVDDLGPKIAPYLLSFYEGARHYPGLDAKGMSSVEEAAKAHQALLSGEEQAAKREPDTVPAPAPKPEPKAETPAAPAAPTEDDGSDIPLAFYKKVQVPHEVWIADEGKYETLDMPAHQALASVREDIDNLKALIKCMRGGA